MGLNGTQIDFLRGLLDGPCFLSASERGDSGIRRLLDLGWAEVERVPVPIDRAAGAAIPVARITPKGREAYLGGRAQ